MVPLGSVPRPPSLSSQEPSGLGMWQESWIALFLGQPRLPCMGTGARTACLQSGTRRVAFSVDRPSVEQRGDPQGEGAPSREVRADNRCLGPLYIIPEPSVAPGSTQRRL